MKRESLINEAQEALARFEKRLSRRPNSTTYQQRVAELRNVIKKLETVSEKWLEVWGDEDPRAMARGGYLNPDGTIDRFTIRRGVKF